MSIPALGTLAIVRDSRAPQKGDLGKAPADDVAATKGASNLDILSATLPTGLVSAYTTCIAALVGLVDKDKPDPEDYEGLRWIAFSVLVIAAIGLVLKKYRDNGGTKVPAAEMLVAAVTSAAFGLGMPESPLALRLGEDYTVAVPILIAFAGVVVTLFVTNQNLQQKR